MVHQQGYSSSTTQLRRGGTVALDEKDEKGLMQQLPGADLPRDQLVSDWGETKLAIAESKSASTMDFELVPPNDDSLAP
jgi:hypothetical protein